MPTLDFKGKQIIYAQHLTVPARTLEVDVKKSLPMKGSTPSPDDNLIIHGDNLHALKALLPRYAGKVNCIYIDPPYNTGNEKWVYNDNVNSPMMKEWLKGKSPVDGEDLERHDKWLCMMWPRLQLLRELLAEDGVIFISIDDNEQHRLRMVMDEIFGEENFVANFVWIKKNVMQNDARFASTNHDHVLCYRKSDAIAKFRRLPRTPSMDARYKNPDNDPKGKWQSVALHAKSGTSSSVYEVKFSNGVTWSSPAGTYPKFSKQVLLDKYDKGELWFGKGGKNKPRLKKYLSDISQGVVTNSVLYNEHVGSTQSATESVQKILGRGAFDSPKSVDLVRKFVALSTDKNAIILDSFAGSGTTAQAVLALNKEDGGKRKFILVECENYADKITAERVRRVIKGVPKSKDENLKNGLGGGFTYCALGDEISIEKMLTGKNLPDYDTLARHVCYTATGQSPAKIRKQRGKDGFFYETSDQLFYLIYEPKLTFLRSTDSALNSDRAERIAKQAKAKKKTALVFATHKFMGQKELTEMGITFCGLPYVA